MGFEIGITVSSDISATLDENVIYTFLMRIWNTYKTRRVRITTFNSKSNGFLLNLILGLVKCLVVNRFEKNSWKFNDKK